MFGGEALFNQRVPIEHSRKARGPGRLEKVPYWSAPDLDGRSIQGALFSPHARKKPEHQSQALGEGCEIYLHHRPSMHSQASRARAAATRNCYEIRIQGAQRDLPNDIHIAL